MTKQMLLIIIVLLIVSSGCHFIDNNNDKIQGWWISTNKNLYIKFFNDSLYIDDCGNEINLYPYNYYEGRYCIAENNKLIIDMPPFDQITEVDTMGFFELKNGCLKIHFYSGMKDTVVSLNRPEDFENRNLIKIQYSAIGQYVASKFPNYDIQIDSLGNLIFNGISNTKLNGFYKGKNPEIFKYIKQKFNNKNFFPHIKTLRKYRDDHLEPHLVLFWEDATQVIHLLGKHGKVPKELNQIYEYMDMISLDTTLVPFDTSMYFDSHLARFYRFQDTLSYLSTYNNKLYQPVSYPGGQEQFWKDFKKFTYFGKEHSDYETLKKTRPLWLDLIINENGEVIECNHRNNELSAAFFRETWKAFKKMPNWSPAIYAGNRIQINIHVLHFMDIID